MAFEQYPEKLPRPTVFTVLKKDYPSQRPYYALSLHGARVDGVSYTELDEVCQEQVIQKVLKTYSDDGDVQQVSEEEFHRIQAERKAAYASHSQI